MPGRDGSGPRGLGPMTGRGMGFCAVPGSTSHFGPGGVWGTGAYGPGGRGWRNRLRAMGLSGRGRGWGCWGLPAGRPAWTAKEELSDLGEYAEGLEAELRAVRERLEAAQRGQGPSAQER